MQTKKEWRVPRKNDHGAVSAKAIQPGDTGFWVTCQKNKEGKCVHEMRDWLTDLAERLYPQALEAKAPDAMNEDADEEEVDIEKAIAAEVKDIRKPVAAQLFTPVKLDMQCGEYW